MSLFGKILALLNIFGAIALIYFASAAYAKRQAWAHSKFRHEVVLKGLPLDEQEQTASEENIAHLLGKDTLNTLFQSAGQNPVRTQVAEVERLKGQLDSKLQAATTPRAKTLLLSRILLPLADQHIEREQLLAIQTTLASDADEAKLRERYRTAFAQASAEVAKKPLPGDPPARSFEDAFRAAVRAQGGPRSEAFTSMMLQKLPAMPVEKAFDECSAAQLQQLQHRYDELFASALTGHPIARRAESQTQSKRSAVEMQKDAIARLLLGLALFQAEDAVSGAAAAKPAGADVAIRLADTDAYRNQVKRLMVVCGVRAGLQAISDQAAVQRQLIDYLAGTIQDERGTFAADHAFYVDALRKQAALLLAEIALREESKRKLTVQQEQVKKRQREVKEHQDELKELEARTADSMTQLRKISEDLLNQRTEARDLIRKTLESEKTLRELELKIREIERSKNKR
jgi:hypothetical protein